MSAHRKRRIAADEAHSWARNLRLRNPYAKLVLCMLTLYVDGAGACFVGIEELALDTELSTDTVRKRLAWLERVGAIARFPQWLDANGRRNGEGRGKRTTDEIRLLTDADPDVIEARALGDDVSENEPGDADKGAISPSHEQGQQTENKTVSPAVALCQPSHCSEGLISEPEPEDKKDSPPTPQAGGDGSSVDQPSEAASEPASGAWSGSETWPTFEAAYSEPILRQSIARQVWSALTEPERTLAIKAAKGYVAHRRSQKKPPNVLNAHTFLRERDAWAGFAELAPAEPQQKFFIAESSTDFDALRVLAIVLDRAMTEARFDVERGTKGIWRYGIVPLDLAALSAFAGKPTDQWAVVEDKTKPFYAWCERIAKWTGHRPEPQRVMLDGTTEIKMPDGRTMVAQKRTFGLRVPCLFPPRKDGTIAAAEITDSEAREFTDTG